MMVITCYGLDDLIEITMGYAKKGITFEADTRTMTITLTGGF